MKKRWDYLVESDERLRELERKYAQSPKDSAAVGPYAAYLTRHGREEEGDRIENIFLLNRFVGTGWGRPSDDEVERVARHYSTTVLRSMMEAKVVNRVTALRLTHNTVVYHRHWRNSDGSPMRWRVSGNRKYWKTRPDDYRIPVKYGMGRRSEHNGYVTQDNGHLYYLNEDDVPNQG